MPGVSLNRSSNGVVGRGTDARGAFGRHGGPGSFAEAKAAVLAAEARDARVLPLAFIGFGSAMLFGLMSTCAIIAAAMML